MSMTCILVILIYAAWILDQSIRDGTSLGYIRFNFLKFLKNRLKNCAGTFWHSWIVRGSFI